MKTEIQEVPHKFAVSEAQISVIKTGFCFHQGGIRSSGSEIILEKLLDRYYGWIVQKVLFMCH